MTVGRRRWVGWICASPTVGYFVWRWSRWDVPPTMGGRLRPRSKL